VRVRPAHAARPPLPSDADPYVHPTREESSVTLLAENIAGLEVRDGAMRDRLGITIGLTIALDVECDGDHCCDKGHTHDKTLTALASLDRREIAALHELLGEWLDQHGHP
jgi:hypothetical protein